MYMKRFRDVAMQTVQLLYATRVQHMAKNMLSYWIFQFPG